MDWRCASSSHKYLIVVPRTVPKYKKTDKQSSNAPVYAFEPNGPGTACNMMMLNTSPRISMAVHVSNLFWSSRMIDSGRRVIVKYMYLGILVHCDWDAGLLNDVIKWKHFPRYWPFLRGIHRSVVNFPAQRPVTQSFYIFLDLCLIKRLSEHSRGWWFELLSRPLWRRCNGYHVLRYLASINDDISFINIPNIIQDQIKARLIDLVPSIN